MLEHLPNSQPNDLNSKLTSQGTDATNECISKIVLAGNLEKSGDLEGAIALYQEVLERDKEGNYGAVAQKALLSLKEQVLLKPDKPSFSPEAVQALDKRKSPFLGWQKLSLRVKATILMIGFSIIPILGTGSIAYYFANKSITKQITKTEESHALGMADALNAFMFERYGDVQILSQLPIFSHPKVRSITTVAEKNAILDNYIKAYGIYDNIAVFDLQGNAIAQTQGKPVLNHLHEEFFQEVLKTGQIVISQPEFSKSANKIVIRIAAPVRDKATGQMIGIVRVRLPVEALEDIVKNFSSKGEEYHVFDSTGKFFIAEEEEKLETSVEESFPSIATFNAQKQAGATENVDSSDGEEELIAYAPVPKHEVMPELNWGTVIGTPTDIAFAPQRQLLWIFGIGTGLAALAASALAVYLVNKATRPIIEAAKAVEKVGQGELDIRIPVQGNDEIATLGSNINLMSEQIQDLLEQQKAEAQKQEAEAASQRQAKENLQQEVVKLLLEIEGAQKGDLTVKGKVTEGVVGSIADAFNTTINKLRELVQQVQSVSNHVNEMSLSGEASVRQLSYAALTQASEITQALQSVANINSGIQKVASSASEAAKIARQASTEAQEGDATMDKTVDSIEKIRSTVAGTSKKVKQLAESSQEISQIVDIISGISEKTNLLAFNASVEAARAGENGQGFRVVAEEVRRLADRVTESTKEIQYLVTTIQQETATVLQAMENSTTEVVTGTGLVLQTKQILQGIAMTSQQIDTYLQEISSSTTTQTQASAQVNQKMSGVSTIASETSVEAQEVVKSIQMLAEQARVLQIFIAQFRLQS